jgi:hypothetical protein
LLLQPFTFHYTSLHDSYRDDVATAAAGTVAGTVVTAAGTVVAFATRGALCDDLTACMRHVACMNVQQLLGVSASDNLFAESSDMF